MAEPTVNPLNDATKTMGFFECRARTGAPVLFAGYDIGKALLNGESLSEAVTIAGDNTKQVAVENFKDLEKAYEACKEYVEDYKPRGVLHFVYDLFKKK